MEESLLIRKAKSLIRAAEGKKQSVVERKDQAIALAALMIDEARRIHTPAERSQQSQLEEMMQDPLGKVFTTTFTDQCFRSHNPQRVADQLIYVIKKFGIPSYLSFFKRLALRTFMALGKPFAHLTVPLTIRMLRKETNHVIMPGEAHALSEHMKKRRKEGVRINLNHIGEAILGEEEAERRLQTYLNDLTKPDVEYISVKISTIYSQINLLAWEETLNVLVDRLKQLYRAAMKHSYVRADGVSCPKFVNLDMEEYRDLHMTIELFRRVLDEPEFFRHEAGIVLQSYLPDSYLIQQELTVWAMQRVAQGGAPIKIRIVKGANLAMEQFESALRLWPQAPYPTKSDVDANYKRMVVYGSQKEHARAAHLGIASHNLFDVAYALLLRAENGVEKEVSFEMLEGMADPMRRVVQQLAGDILLYCPAATQEEFQNAVAYLVRRLDENTAPENFLRHAFDLKPDSSVWKYQAKLFSDACLAADQVPYLPERTQNRLTESTTSEKMEGHFENEPDTDWSLPQNRRWAHQIVQDWKTKTHDPVPLVIGGNILPPQEPAGNGEDPSHHDQILYRYALATENQVDIAITTAKNTESEWSKTSVEERCRLLEAIAQELRAQRGDLIGAMMADTGKTIPEGDVEVSEAIDFANYYRMNLDEWHHLPDIAWNPKGTVLVAPPWNFPCSIPSGGILAALAAGNCVIFKPPAESVLVGWHLVQLFWKAGISRQVLQFVCCEDDPVGSRLVKDPRISAIVLTGATSTAKLFLRMRPGVDLMAETGGKNALVVTAMADRDLAIKDIVHSAFGHSGQKCSACSLAILEAEVYDDAHFLNQLRDAAASLPVGSPWNLKNKVNPLIRPPNPTLLKGLTTLEAGEQWLLEPKQDPHNPNSWSPGIKLGVKPGSFSFQNELFGPVLSLVRAENVEKAFELMNQTPYGLTAGIHSLDEREQEAWLENVEAGNCYVNRTITGAIVERQPFGGCKESSFGKGAKAGGPNYLVQFMIPKQIDLPTEIDVPNPTVNALFKAVEKSEDIIPDDKLWKASVGSYAFYWNYYFCRDHDPSLVRGQDNIHRYVPHHHVVLRAQKGDSALNLLRVIAAALTCGTAIEVSVEEEIQANQLRAVGVDKIVPLKYESDAEFTQRVEKETIKRIRFLQHPSPELLAPLAEAACNLNIGPVLANGRLELLHYIREISISSDYHRYGNLGERENEPRHPLPGQSQAACQNQNSSPSCGSCGCHG